MTRLPKTWFVAALLLSASVCAAAEPNAESLQLTLPPVGYATVGAEMNVYFDNLVLADDSQELKFVVTSDLGTTESRRWTATPTEDQIGDHNWQVEVLKGDQSLAKGTMRWHVSPAQVKTPREVSLLLIGDSLTHATLYPNEIAQRLDYSGLSKWTMFGTHRPTNAGPGVAHEGYGGWTWESFLKRYVAKPDLAKRQHSSPFVFLDEKEPKLNISKYLEEACQGKTPDYVVIFLGINDCFRADSQDPVKLDQHIDRVLQNADAFLQAFHQAAPETEFGLCLCTPGNSRDEAFTANYQDKYTRDGWKRIQHRLVQRQLKHFGGDHPLHDQLEIIPLELNLDTIDGYPSNNAVHPNAAGYKQIGASIHAWLMAQLTKAD
ncbi:SGNH/GDSL hydrolase family protein [Blastopirellula sp. JC732]|uniref:SGNH/GDSL hydrolase family protein n=1 Tax=Blastopirellula sediminis TaxID=2894196 RepID=A0A9X1SH72_9BACT|nr:SGNH/GDSL hydrolase family protein [Blastopirellula sediminis]MCC9605805.1 SGNH/GDSL hydrolase family protein [Blastopirellula sediminis]MCC9630895.1 SGNH/GDSL hydrolase family protein [Blastopirellula sediminis]